MPKCKTCEEAKDEYTVEEVFDYSSGVMFAGGQQGPRTFKCSNGHTWEEE